MHHHNSCMLSKSVAEMLNSSQPTTALVLIAEKTEN